MSEDGVSQNIIGRSVSLLTFCMALILSPSLNRVAPDCRIETLPADLHLRGLHFCTAENTAVP